MPPRDPLAIQLDFPQLTADLINQLQLTGQLGLLNFLPEVRPVFIVGERGLSITTEEPLLLPAQITSGQAVNPAALTVVADSGQLPAGDYDIQLFSSCVAVTMVTGEMQFQHRNAANSASLSFWSVPMAAGTFIGNSFKMGLVVAENERVRFITNIAIAAGMVSATIHHRIRPAP